MCFIMSQCFCRRQTARQPDRQSERQRDRKTDRQTERERETDRGTSIPKAEANPVLIFRSWLQELSFLDP